MKLKTLLILLALIACGQPEMSDPQDSGHVHGAAATMDSSGTEVRSPVRITSAEERALGVAYTVVGFDSIVKSIRTVGRIRAPEPGIHDVTLKVDGFVEELFVTYTGQEIVSGEPLVSIYSPALLRAQEDLVTAARMVDASTNGSPGAAERARGNLEAARRRLELWDLDSLQISEIERTREPNRTMILRSPATGIVLHKDVVEGQHVSAGYRLLQVADLDEVWVEGEVFEQDLQFVGQGSRVHVEVSAYPGTHTMAAVDFVYPTVDEMSRTNRIRTTLPNSDLRYKPGMFATLFIDAVIPANELVVPLEGVVVTGERNLVFRRVDGVLHATQVVLGARAGNRVQILAGLDEGDSIVTAANFLIDAESRLGGGSTSMPGMQHGAVDVEEAPETGHDHD